MTREEYHTLNSFPVEMVTLSPYRAGKDMSYRLKSGDTFTAIGKVTLGKDDYSILDEFGYPHHFDGCNLLYKD